MANQPSQTFIGREPELAVLTAALDNAVSGRGQMVMLAGEPGIGKTRTAQELVRRAQESDVRVLWGWCYEGEGAPPYWPWVDPLRTYLQATEPELLRKQLGSAAAPIGAMIPELLGIIDDIEPLPNMEPDQARFRLFDSIVGFLKRASEDSPIMLVLDDLHWADPPSLMLLEFVARQLDGSRILVVGTFRDTEAPPESPLGGSLGRLARLPSFQRQTMTGLPSEDVGSFVLGETGLTPSEPLLSAIHAHTEGNPFFLGEVARYLVETGRLGGASGSPVGSENLGIPQGIRDVIGQRLLRLTEPCNQALTAASVIGREFEFNLLSALAEPAGGEELLDLMDEAISARIIEDLPGGTTRYQFRHALMQQTLNESIPSGRKIRLHARIGEALEDSLGDDPGDRTAELAHHFTQAASLLGNEKMLRYTILAGERALKAYVWEEAAEHFTRGLGVKGVDPTGNAPAADPESASLLFGLSRAISSRINFGQEDIDLAVANLRSAFEYHLAAGEIQRAMEIAQSAPRTPVGLRCGLTDILEMALKIAPPGSTAEGRLLANLGWVAGMSESDYPAAERSFQKAVDIARANGDGLLLQRTLAQAAQVDFYHCRFLEAIEKTKRILEIPAAELDLSAECAARYVECICSNAVGRPIDQSQLDTFLAVAERLGTRLWLHFAHWMSERAAGLRGDWESARRSGELGLAAAPGAPTLLWTMPHIELETGRFDQAEALFQQLSGRLQATPDNTIYQFAAVMVAGESHWYNGASHESGFPPWLADIISSSTFEVPVFAAAAHAGLAFDALARGDKEACRLAYERLSWLSGFSMTVIPFDRLLGQLALEVGQVQPAIEHFEASLAFCSEAGYRPEYAWTCWGYAAALLERKANGDRRRAEESLSEAHQIAADLGMPPLLQRIEDLMSRIGQPSAPAYPDGLTQREVEVLRLVAAGRTDREIAEELIIGVRTVNTHVGNILNKTGTANRAEAVNYANQNGLVEAGSERGE